MGPDARNGGESPEVRAFFGNKTTYVFGAGKLEGLLPGIAKSARMSYITAWKQWFQF